MGTKATTSDPRGDDSPSNGSDHPGLESPVGRRFRLGCAVWGWSGWLGDLIPDGTPQRAFLERYAERVDAVEGNTMFWAVPSAETLERWAAQVPSGFHFCPKLPRSITHDGPLAPAAGSVRAFQDLMLEHLAPDDKLGVSFAQLPPSYGPHAAANAAHSLGDIEALLDAWQHEASPLALEVRHPDWFESAASDALNALLRDRRVARVTLDTRPIYECDDDPQRDSNRQKPQLPVHPTLTSATVMVRYIGHPRLEQNASYLDQWAAWVVRALERDVVVYFFVHCPNETHSPTILRDFHRRLVALDAPVPPLRWDQAPSPPTQGTLF